MRKRRRKLRLQITCYCFRYSFPHRLGGGKCFGRCWALSYFENERYECANCQSNYNGCEVANGSEHIRHCEGAKDHLRMLHKHKHPLYGVPEYEPEIEETFDLEEVPF